MKISIIVPTRDRADALALTLPTLASQTFPATDYEILIVDNGSTDHTARVVAESSAEYPLHVFRYILDATPGSTSARHCGAREAASDLLVYVDDDIDADPGWLQAMIDTFADQQVELVGGPSLPKYGVEPPHWLNTFWSHRANGGHSCGYLSLVDLGDQPFEMENPNYIWSLNFAIRKQTLAMLGGFHPDRMPWELRRFQGSGEAAVTRKAKALGLKAVYQPRALVYHRVPETRLTVEYFEQRSYVQGICDSFRDIRDSGLLPATSTGNGLDWKAQLRGAKRLAKSILRSLRLLATDPYEEMKNRVRVAYQAGYQYHQDEVRKDPELLKWVLRQDYWDATVPSN